MAEDNFSPKLSKVNLYGHHTVHELANKYGPMIAKLRRTLYKDNDHAGGVIQTPSKFASLFFCNSNHNE